MKSSKEKSYALRIEGNLVDPLQRLKKEHRRSLNAEINAALASWVAQLGSSDAAEMEAAGVTGAAVDVTPAPRGKKERKLKKAIQETVDG